jgi:uncharacterized repeat protein (TIGR01451 family)
MMLLKTWKLLRMLWPALLATGLLSVARLALAAPPTITSVQPGNVPSGLATTLAVSGSGFITDTVVIIDGYGALDTTVINPGLLTAALPGIVPPGTYSVRVVSADGSAVLANALTVSGPTPTPAPTNFVRPQLIVQSYGASSRTINPNENLDFEMTLQNAGQSTATNVIATFTSGDFIPRVTGGVRAVSNLAPGGSARFFQPLFATKELAGKRIATLEVKVDYTTETGTAYNDTFLLTFDVTQPAAGPARPTATPTARPVLRPQLLVAAYRWDIEKLQPGNQFVLEMDVKNLGSAAARRVTLIVGGGSASTGGTQQPGGVSGGSGDFTNFAPVQASNVQSLGDMEVSAGLTAKQALIVNATTKPGAYPLKLSFLYTDDRGNSYTDDQAITLLVHQLPQLEISFSRDPGPMFAGQPNQLPIQIINLGRNSTVLGNVRVTAEGAEFSNNVSLVGALDPGGQFPLDAVVIPSQPGPLQLMTTVDYTDDFNQPQKITATLEVNVLEGGPIEPGPGGEPPGGEGPGIPPPVEETAWDKFLRFLSGFFGLDSAVPQPAFPGGEFPPGEIPPGQEPQPVPVQPGPKG